MIKQLPIALTMGEPAGISGELTLQAWLNREKIPVPFFVIDDPNRLISLAQLLNLPVPIQEISTPEDTENVFKTALPIIRQNLQKKVQPGFPNKLNSSAVIQSIEKAVKYTYNHQAAAIVTNPVCKSTLYSSGFQFPGQTEFLASLNIHQDIKPVMMLACSTLRVVPVTIHIPVSLISKTLTAEAIIHSGKITAEALKIKFGIKCPKLGISSLNPHAGENQSMGTEEVKIIAPAIKSLKDLGIDADGPYPADTLFHSAARSKFDAIICMYHDQALIPLKTIDFLGGVNITLGLDFIRTSPDHGTAFDIAGKGISDASSLIQATCIASQMKASQRL